MNYYQELTLILQAEIPLYFIWQKLYIQLHLALVEQQDEAGNVPFGVTFPEYRDPIYPVDYTDLAGGKLQEAEVKKGHLGHKLRIFAETEAQLQQLNLAHWLVRLNDYVHSTGIHEVVPKRIKGYVSFSRKHANNSFETQTRRYVKRCAELKKISIEEAHKQLSERYANADNSTLPHRQSHYQQEKITRLLPYIQFKSLSNQHAFCLLIQRTAATQLINEGFNSYGLSKTSTLPDF